MADQPPSDRMLPHEQAAIAVSIWLAPALLFAVVAATCAWRLGASVAAAGAIATLIVLAGIGPLVLVTRHRR